MSGRILLVDDIAANRVMIRAKLASAYYDVLVAETAEDVHRLVRSEQPSVVLINVTMPTLDAFGLCHDLKSSWDTALTPIVMMTSVDDAEDRLRALEVGADDFLVKPIHDLALFARVRNLMRMKFVTDELQLRAETTRELGLDSAPAGIDDIVLTPAHSVLIAAPDHLSGAAWVKAIRDKLAVQVDFVTSEKGMANRIAADVPDAFVVHQTLADSGDGLRLISTIARRQPTRHSALLFLVSDNDMSTAAKALDLGAWDYVMPPHDLTELAVRLRSQLRRKLYSDMLRTNLRDGLRLAAIDPLTGLYNRRYADHHLGNMLTQARAEGSDLALLILDLDRFKSVNDSYGHDAGDEVLRQVARRLQETVRGVDVVVRLGGEEFCVALPGTSRKGALQVAERIRRAIADQKFEIGTRDPIVCTASFGVAVSIAGADNVQQLLTAADRALYKAKAGGRDRIATAWDD